MYRGRFPGRQILQPTTSRVRPKRLFRKDSPPTYRLVPDLRSSRALIQHACSAESTRAPTQSLISVAKHAPTLQQRRLHYSSMFHHQTLGSLQVDASPLTSFYCGLTVTSPPPVAGQFATAWKHTPVPPRVVRVYKIIHPKATLDRYEAYK